MTTPAAAYEPLLVELHREMRAGRGEGDRAQLLRAEMDRLWYELDDEQQELFDELSEDLYVIEDKRHVVPLADGETVGLVDQQMRLAYEANEEHRALSLIRKLPTIDAAIAHTMGRCWERLGFVHASACFDAFANELVSKPSIAAPQIEPAAASATTAPTRASAASDLTVRALRKRIHLPSQFTYPVLVEHVTLDEGMALVRVSRPDGGQEEVTLEVEELEDALAAASGRSADLVSGRDVFDALEAVRIRLAYAYDPYFAVSLSGVRALPHQLEAVYERLLPQARLRFVLAHDPGAGKTIMAGLLIKELKLRGALDRILILVPAPLAPQWQDELSDKFGETFEIIDSHAETSQVAGNIWQRFPQVIASIDYAKRHTDDNSSGRSVRDSVLQCSWDMVIVDEAHKASAAQYGNEVKPTKRYKLVEELSRSPQVHNLLLLTATPHQGKDDQFRLFLRLLDPDQFEAQNMAEIAKLLEEDRCPFFLRRIKEDLRDFDGRKLFVPRNAWTEPFELNGAELDLYEDVNRYIRDYLGRSYTGRRRMAVALARSVLQRRLASSLNAITESLRRRLERLSELHTEVEKLPPAEREKRLRDAGVLDVDDEAEYDDSGEDEHDQAVTDVSVAETVEGLRKEVAELRRLHGKAAAIRDAPWQEQKLVALRKCLDRAQFNELQDASGKLLIFTEHRDTLNHLEKKLKEWGYRVVTIHGGHSPLDRKEKRRQFEQETQICVATDAAGEGINLQFCHLMINYDVPWNPNRLEQRMGRIHRIGQDKEVHVFNFVAVNTEEGKVLKTLIDKIQAIKVALKSDRIFDVIGPFLRAKNLNPEDVLRDAAINPKRATDFVNDVQRLSSEDLERLRSTTDVALARRQLDLSQLNGRTQLHEDLRLMPEYVERFFLDAAQATGLAIEQRADGLYRISSVPQRFRSPTLRAVQRYGVARDRYLKATFRKDQRVGRNADAELLSPGHPLYAAAIELFEAKLGHVEGSTALFMDPRSEEPYYLHAFEVGVVGESADLDPRTSKSDTLEARFVPIIEQLDGTFEVASQDILHDLTPLAGASEETDKIARDHELTVGPLDAERARKAASWVRLRVQHGLVKAQQARRAEDATIRRNYLERAFDARLHRMREAEWDIHARVAAGEQGAQGRLSIVADEIQQTERLRTERLRAVERLRVARAGDVRHLASVIILPAPRDSDAHRLMKSDPVVEAIAMKFVMMHEVARKWDPQDVHDLKDGRGYDILSTGPVDAETQLRPVRRIEVKGRSTPDGDVALTRNEWIKAARLGRDYWLYVVYHARAGAEPRLMAIQDPVRVLGAASKPLTVVKGYWIAGEAIERAAKERA